MVLHRCKVMDRDLSCLLGYLDIEAVLKSEEDLLACRIIRIRSATWLCDQIARTLQDLAALGKVPDPLPGLQQDLAGRLKTFAQQVDPVRN
jgi:hypothetical protein